MSTSCLICCGEQRTNKIYCARCQYDGYPEYVGRILKNTRNTYKKALEISRDYGNFFSLKEDGEPDRIDTHYNKGYSYELKYCTPDRLVDIVLRDDEFFEIDYVYYFSELSNKWICFGSDGSRIIKENNQKSKTTKFEMGLRANRSVSPLKKINQERQYLVKNLQKLQSQIDSGLAKTNDYNRSLSKIANNFYSLYIQATDIQQFKNNDDIEHFIKNTFGDLIDDSYVHNDKICFEIFVQTEEKLGLEPKLILDDAFGVSYDEKVNIEIAIIDDTTVNVVVKINC